MVDIAMTPRYDKGMKAVPTIMLIGGLAAVFLAASPAVQAAPPSQPPAVVSSATLLGKVMCGYQGWFRCPGDPSGLGWVHWSRDAQRFAPDTVSFEMWPDMREYGASERYPAPGFTYPDGTTAQLFSSDNPDTVLRHFTWMRDYGIDGAWLQHFVVDLPGGPLQERYPSRLRVLGDVRMAAKATGRVWALSYDIAGMPSDRIYDVLTSDWRKMVASGVTADARYLHQNGKPVVQIWGFYRNSPGNAMTADLANRLIDFFHRPGPATAYLVGGGDWDWRVNPNPAWQAAMARLDAYVPWNIGNYSTDAAGTKSAGTQTWAQDQQICKQRGQAWIPTVYPGFSWDNLMQKPPGTTLIPRRGGQFLWEQFVALAKLHVTTVYVAMFDEVDEGTAIFKVTNTPPTQAHFVTYDGLPTDWYLRLVGDGAQMLHGQRPFSATLPAKEKK